VQRRGDGWADVLPQREHPRLVGVARAEVHSAFMPIEIVEAEGGHGMGTEPSLSEQQEQGLMAQGFRGLSRRGDEDALYLLGFVYSELTP
jgi:hypothetical protein